MKGPPRAAMRRLGGGLAALGLFAAVLTACSSARTDVGTTDESCYLALPTAARAVGEHGHLAGVRKFSPSSLKAAVPRLSVRLEGEVPKGQNICLVAYTGHFTAEQATKPIGRPAGTIAVAVVTSPGNELLGTLILLKVPLRFQHMF